MATRSWANRPPRGVVEQISGRSWANSPGGGIVEDQAAAAAPEEDAGLFIAGQQQPVIERAGMIPY